MDPKYKRLYYVRAPKLKPMTTSDAILICLTFVQVILYIYSFRSLFRYTNIGFCAVVKNAKEKAKTIVRR